VGDERWLRVPAEEKDFNSAADTDAQFNYLR